MAFGKRAKTEGLDIEEAFTAPGPGTSETFLDAGSELAGEFRFAQNVRLEGRLEGKLWAAKNVVVGEVAEIDASIEADSLEIYGSVVGDIRIARQTTLHKTARVEGEIRTAGIVVEEGARFKGCIVIGPDEESKFPYPPISTEPPAATSDELAFRAESDDEKKKDGA